MKDLLLGLEELGFGDLNDLDAFKPNVSEETTVKITSNSIPIEECVYDKSHTCPVCDKRFKEKSVKSSKLRFVDVDTDLMPRYSPVNPFYYNIVICPNCGYAALSENFLKITGSQCNLIKNQITPKFTKKSYDFPLTEEAVIERYKYALLNSVIKRGRVSERAYICLVISWVYKIIEDEANRLIFARNACEGFESAYSSDSFPFYGMNEIVTAYLIAELASYTGDNDSSLKWLSKVLSSRLATAKVKDMALDLKNRINKQARLV